MFFSSCNNFGSFSKFSQDYLDDNMLVMVYVAGANSLRNEVLMDINSMEKGLFLAQENGMSKLKVVALVDKDYEIKKNNEKNGVAKMLEPLSEKTRNYYLDLWVELNERETDIAKFVHQIDKLDAVMRAKKYAEVYNRPELFEEFYNRQVEDKTFEGSVLETFFKKLKD